MIGNQTYIDDAALSCYTNPPEKRRNFHLHFGILSCCHLQATQELKKGLFLYQVNHQQTGRLKQNSCYFSISQNFWLFYNMAKKNAENFFTLNRAVSPNVLNWLYFSFGQREFYKSKTNLIFTVKIGDLEGTTCNTLHIFKTKQLWDFRKQ